MWDQPFFSIECVVAVGIVIRDKHRHFGTVFPTLTVFIVQAQVSVETATYSTAYDPIMRMRLFVLYVVSCASTAGLRAASSVHPARGEGAGPRCSRHPRTCATLPAHGSGGCIQRFQA